MLERWSVRPTTRQDAVEVAHLLTALYRAQFPKLVTCGPAPLEQFLETLLLAEDGRRLEHLYVGEQAGHVVGLVGVATARDARAPVRFPGMAREMLRCFGAAGTARLLVPITRSSAPRVAAGDVAVAVVHSVVVAAGARREGHGARLMQFAEQEARARRCTAISLQVAEGNDAIDFYLQRGYSVVGKLPEGRIAYRLAYGTCLLRKTLPMADVSRSNR
jgi:GNAT superfamily N-acetyltransferase